MLLTIDRSRAATAGAEDVPEDLGDLDLSAETAPEHAALAAAPARVARPARPARLHFSFFT